MRSIESSDVQFEFSSVLESLLIRIPKIPLLSARETGSENFELSVDLISLRQLKMTATVEVTSPAELQDDDTKNDIASTKEVIEQEELISMKVDQSMVEQNVSEEQNDETDPTCQAIQEVLRSEDSSFEHSQDEQLLSIANLLEDSNHLADRIVPLVDADLSKQAPSQDRSNQQDLYLVDLPVEAEMRSSDQLEISPNNIHQFKGFSEAKPKLSFASQKMKDYFESFRGHHREKMRLYQFFKSIRTEMVACLLFTLISSHALIVCRTSLYESSLDTSAAANDDAQARRAADIRIGGESRAQLGISQFGSERKAAVHLLTGLVTSLTVASLTQVFGHVSGCHLIPSISVALYVKGHISRARLFSYLFAQFVGSLIGVSLLGLLTTSQVTPDDYREILQSPNQAGFAIRANSLPLEFAINAKAVDPLRDETHPGRHRNRRGADLHLEDGLINDVNFSSDPFQASETILLSIEELQQRRQLDKRNQISREADVEPPEKEAGSGSRALPANYNDATFARIDKIAPSSTSSRPNKSGDSEMRAAELISQSTRLSQVVALSQPKREIQPDRDEVARILKRTNKGTSNELDDSDKAMADIGFKKRLSGAYIDPESQQRGCDQSKLSDSYGASVDNHKPLKLRRKKRNRLVNNTASLPPTDTSQFDSNSEGSRFYINLLGFGLPDPIMSSESIRQCIELQSSELQQQSQLDATTMNKKRLARLADNGFQHCLSLSNSSQMFVFQLLASLIIVLTYLVNVDPRRVDLGFKSLSIGLSYFVANALAVSSNSWLATGAVAANNRPAPLFAYLLI